jgi:hypothetical protein
MLPSQVALVSEGTLPMICAAAGPADFSEIHCGIESCRGGDLLLIHARHRREVRLPHRSQSNARVRRPERIRIMLGYKQFGHDA